MGAPLALSFLTPGKWPQPKALGLPWNDLSTASTARLAEADWSQLQQLILTYNSMDSSAIAKSRLTGGHTEPQLPHNPGCRLPGQCKLAPVKTVTKLVVSDHSSLEAIDEGTMAECYLFQAVCLRYGCCSWNLQLDWQDSLEHGGAQV